MQFIYNTINKIKDLSTNAYYYINTDDETKINDKKYINDIIANANYDMTEIRNKTDKALEYDNESYCSIVKYMGGYCWLNSKLNKGERPYSFGMFNNNKNTQDWTKLDDVEKHIYNNINKTINNVESLSYSINLFHGFELYSNYGEKYWIIDKIFSMKSFISKTPSIKVARNFAYNHNNLQPKLLLVHYSKESKHINLDIRPHNEEYEYLTKSDEKLKLIKICRLFVFPFIMETYYICTSLD